MAARWLALALVLAPAPAQAYGVLSHLAVVDTAWEHTLAPALRQRFPSLTEDELRRAHAFAYGGALAPDMGYYPGGSRALAVDAGVLAALAAHYRDQASVPPGLAPSLLRLQMGRPE